ncbi:MAG: TrkH family potassium uptake protein [Breznakibacter sp.]|nr:TrkH family potassium uptake protein [Breznakibacter sp.]
MVNFRFVWLVLGLLLVVEGILILLTSIIPLIYNEADFTLFLGCGASIILFGGLIAFLNRKTSREVGKREGYLAVTLVWIVMSLFGAIPYWINGAIPSYTDAFFETMSGFTTTGATILNNIESLSHGILFWRALTQWVGGMGIIVLSLAILPLLGIGGMQLFGAEATGLTTDKLHPRIKETAKRLWLIYVLFTVAEVALLWIGGMSLFDAVCHSFTTMATGGYGTKQAGIAYYNSPYIEYVIIAFMYIAGVNFTLYYWLFKGKFETFFKDEEFRFYTGITFLFTIVISVILYFAQIGGGIENSFRDSLFQVVSILSTTGFGTVDYMLWPLVAAILLLLTMFISASAGSTSGGIKVVRITILIKNSYYELKRLIHPSAIIPIRLNNRAVPTPIVTSVLAFVSTYFFIFGFGTMIMTGCGLPLDSAAGSVATCMANIGPGLGNTGPASTFAHISDFGKWFLSACMLLGRLELFTVLLLFAPEFWKK